MANFLTYPIFKDIILPFVLLFTLIFAVLEKSKLLGEGKQQINAIIAFVLAAIVIPFYTQISWIRQLVVFLAVALFILFIFMIIYGFIYGDKEGDPLKNEKWVKPTLGAVALIAVVVAVMVITGAWEKLKVNGELGANIIFVIVIIAGLVAVIAGSGKGKSESK